MIYKPFDIAQLPQIPVFKIKYRAQNIDLQTLQFMESKANIVKLNSLDSGW